LIRRISLLDCAILVTLSFCRPGLTSNLMIDESIIGLPYGLLNCTPDIR
jgi:hypothetical protein